MKRVVMSGLVLLALFSFSCSDLYGVGVSHGEPTRAFRDTVVIPENHVVLPESGFARVDSLYEGVLLARDGFSFALSLTVSNTMTDDSLSLLASWAATDSLSFVWKNQAGLQPAWLNVAQQGERLRYSMRARLLNGGSYQLTWVWPAADSRTNFLLGLGYSSASSPQVLSHWSLLEFRDLAPNRTLELEPGVWTWRALPVAAGDSVSGFIDAPATLEAYLVNSAVMQLFRSQFTAPSQTLYNRSSGEDGWKIRTDTADTLYWLLHNSGSGSIVFRDSVRTWKTYQGM